jgi:hypothetical protein
VTASTTMDTRTVLGLASQKKAAPRPVRTTVTAKEPVPVPVAETPSFTVIRDGKISKQESPTTEKKPNSN